MEDIRIIAVDMDGTLLDEDHTTVPQRNLAALRAAAERGVKVAIASGRAWSLVQDAAEMMDCVHYAITAGGAATLDIPNRVWIGRDCLPNSQSVALMGILKERGRGYEIFCDGRSYMERWCRDQILGLELGGAYEELFRAGKIDVVEDAAEVLAGREVEKFHVFYVSPEEREGLIAQLQTTGSFDVCTGTPDNLEINLPGVGKGSALAGLCAELGIPRECAMAFGDADNDLSMLSWAGWSFAMENGTDAVKAAARFAAPPNYEAGVGQMVERYVLDG